MDLGLERQLQIFHQIQLAAKLAEIAEYQSQIVRFNLTGMTKWRETQVQAGIRFIRFTFAPC